MQAEGTTTCRETGRGATRGVRGELRGGGEMDEPNYPPIFFHGAEAQSKRGAEKEKVNNRNVSNDGGR